MDFDSIEGLTDEAVNFLYDDNVEHVGTWFGTYCRTFHNFSSSLCVNAFNSTFAKCHIHCESSIQFTADAMQFKCNNYCGGASSFTDVSAHVFVLDNASWRFHVDCNFKTVHYYGTHYAYDYPIVLRSSRCYLLQTR